MESAILREKSVKGWKRAWKLALIEKGNPAGATCMRNSSGLDSGFRRNDGPRSTPFARMTNRRGRMTNS